MKTKLIALVAIAAGAWAGLEADLAEGAEFEVEPEVAEGLLTEGKARLASEPLTPPAAAVKKARTVKARVLMGCAYGEPNDVVELDEPTAKQAEKDGLVDTEKAAVAFAAKLPQNQTKG